MVAKRSPLRKIKKESSLSDHILQKSKYKNINPDSIPEDIEPDYNKMTPLSDKTRRGNIYIGNYKTAQCKKFFKDNKITAVLNCTRVDEPNHFVSDKNIEYLRINVDDELKKTDIVTMYKLLPLAVNFIYKHADILKNNILIHCSMGAERSVTCFVGYLMKYHKMTPKQACSYSIKKRPTSFYYGHSVNFEDAILKYYKDL